MAYAGGRTFFDADSHLMELPGFLRDYADPDMRDRLPSISFAAGGKMQTSLEELGARGAHSPARVEELIGLGDRLISGPKGYEALGAFNGSERSKALDLLGFQRQLVFATFSPGTFFAPDLEPEIAAAAARAHNRAMADFCANDNRLIGVGATTLDDVDAAIAEFDSLRKLDLGAVWIPHRTSAGRAPGHNDFDPFWARLAGAGIPAVLHVGGAPIQLSAAWMNTGRPIPTDWLGGGENVRGKDMIGLHHGVETFVGTMVLDGVLERHPDLRVGVIELGAGWVPNMLRRLDHIAALWKRSEPELAALTRVPSEQVTQQMAFTPYPFEDVAALINESNADLYLFSSDYPHIKGGRNPLGRFGTSLAGVADEVLEKFYATNMARLVKI